MDVWDAGKTVRSLATSSVRTFTFTFTLMEQDKKVVQGTLGETKSRRIWTACPKRLHVCKRKNQGQLP